jgi:DNA-binding NtrC family response regulator
LLIEVLGDLLIADVVSDIGFEDRDHRLGFAIPVRFELTKVVLRDRAVAKGKHATVPSPLLEAALLRGRGSLFLDEISSLPPEIQAKLLRLLQERAYEPLGEARERTADVRFIAATNRDLEEQVRSGAFRRDLHERLNFAPIRIPALRERTEDIPLLLRHFLDRHDHGRWVEVEPRASAYLQDLDFAWPGNVRHIEQLAARIIMEGLERPVTPADVARLLGSAPVAASVAGDRNTDPPAAGGGAALDAGLPALMQEAERRWLQTALQAHPGLTRAELAAKLKISESALYKKLRAYDLP